MAERVRPERLALNYANVRTLVLQFTIDCKHKQKLYQSADGEWLTEEEMWFKHGHPGWADWSDRKCPTVVRHSMSMRYNESSKTLLLAILLRRRALKKSYKVEPFSVISYLWR